MPVTNTSKSFLITFSRVISLSRPRNAVVPLLALVLGVSMAKPEALNSQPVIIACICVILLNFVATLHNDLEDFQIDQQSDRTTPYLMGHLTYKQIRAAAITFTAVAIGLPLLYQEKYIVLFAIGYSALSVSYNAKPFQLSRRPIASINLLALVFAIIPHLFGTYLAANRISLTVLIFSFGLFLFRWSTSILKDYKDYEPDKKFHKRTFLVSYGAEKTRLVSLVTSITGLILILAIMLKERDYGFVHATLFAVILPLSIYTVYQRWNLKYDISKFRTNNHIFHDILAKQIILELGLIAWFYIS